MAGVYQANRTERLAIVDPNNPENDISGGTKEISMILRCFAKAYQTLKDSIQSAAMSPSGTIRSFLGLILGGNYEAYDNQRAHLKSLYEHEPRFTQNFQPPPPDIPPPPPPSEPPPPPPPREAQAPIADAQQVASQKCDATRFTKRQQNAANRADRLRLLRPDLPYVPKFVDVETCIKLGGYSCLSEMSRDLTSREKALKNN
jgi:non-canonical poly(A) RNA polymerase PAPD5/7